MSTCPRPLSFTTTLLTTAGVAFALTACGGGGDGGSAPPPAPPPAPTPAPPAPSPAPPSEPSPPPQAPPPQTPGGQAADCGFPNFSGEMLRLVNEQRTRGAVCGTESLPAVAALSWNAQLAQASARHADDMAQRSFFSHTGSDGTNAGQRITAAGYTWRAWGENIAYGQTSIAIVVNGWMGSEGHCRNIMSSSFSEMGAACVRSDNQQYRLFWVQNFGRR